MDMENNNEVDLNKEFEKKAQQAFNIKEKRISILKNYGENFQENNYITNPAIGRDQQIKDLILILLTPDKSAVLIGKPGVGKTATVEGLAYRIKNNMVPNALMGYNVVKINSSSLVGKINYEIEYELARHGIAIKRFTNVTYLLLKKRKKVRKYLKKMKNIKYRLGADALDNIYHTRYLCKKGYDGIVHIKSSFCTPEIGAMPIINKIAKKYDVPIIFFSFDTNTSKVGVETRIEAFVDMIKMKRGM